MAPYEALYGRICRSHVGWFEVCDATLIVEKVKLIEIVLRQPKKVMRFGKKGKFSRRYIYLYKILKRVSKVAYDLAFRKN